MTVPALTTCSSFGASVETEMATAGAVGLGQAKLSTDSPTAAGLVLTSTIIGRQRRVAQINGSTYAVGETIAVAADGTNDAANAAIRLVDVQPRRAVLEAKGQRFELSIPEPVRPGKADAQSGGGNEL
jgi:hypothetical protein